VGKLYLVATPIGNLEDITLRALRVLREAALIAAEDTRQTRKLLAKYDISTPSISYHEHNKQARQADLMAALEAGDVALVSDAGTPGISDPGYELVGQAIAAGFEVVPVPGPSAPVTALVASGLPTDAFTFLGYLPRKAAERKALLETLRGETRTVILFEVPHRVQASLAEMEAILGGERRMAAARELTKLHEEFVRGTLAEVRQAIDSKPARGEYTLVLGPAPAGEAWPASEVRKQLAAALERGLSRAAAARRVAEQSGWSRNEVYRLGLEES